MRDSPHVRDSPGIRGSPRMMERMGVNEELQSTLENTESENLVGVKESQLLSAFRKLSPAFPKDNTLVLHFIPVCPLPLMLICLTCSITPTIHCKASYRTAGPGQGRLLTTWLNELTVEGTERGREAEIRNMPFS